MLSVFNFPSDWIMSGDGIGITFSHKKDKMFRMFSFLKYSRLLLILKYFLLFIILSSSIIMKKQD